MLFERIRFNFDEGMLIKCFKGKEEKENYDYRGKSPNDRTNERATSERRGLAAPGLSLCEQYIIEKGEIRKWTLL